MLKLVFRTYFTPQFAVYLTGGVLSALVDIGLLRLLLNQNWDTVPATTVAFLAGLAVNFMFHARFTFNTAMSSSVFMRYLGMVGINYLITLACVTGTDLLWQQPLIGKVLSLPLAAASGFVLGKRWVFR
ncbi:MAG TPA: GtrA family protein [Pseudoduganella sp.]